ncbi:acyl carrier protein [Methylophilaceae bacterium 11]|jgi:acyl carrier protein|uniref:acyl carrier protein n=1 Tax=unclassified Methylotenera TaxID=2643294 RepID=UPI000374F1E2|nr:MULTISPECIES: acyl carrier protein [unclassified Methylotenera]EUJ11585.1 acyl carrier protein [Methylophilaceae bacterium 11]
MTDEEILIKLKAIFADTFEMDTSNITLDSHLFEELDLDSIDAVDLAIKLQNMTGKRIKPEDFKNVRTVRDVVGAVHLLLAH